MDMYTTVSDDLLCTPTRFHPRVTHVILKPLFTLYAVFEVMDAGEVFLLAQRPHQSHPPGPLELNAMFDPPLPSPDWQTDSRTFHWGWGRPRVLEALSCLGSPCSEQGAGPSTPPGHTRVPVHLIAPATAAIQCPRQVGRHPF